MTTMHAPPTGRKPKTAPHAPWIGPHFFVDLVRLTRKGWPTWARVGYLSAMLASMAFMFHMQARSTGMRPAEYAVLAHHFAITLIVIQNLLIIVLAPVYVASAIAEEKENNTLEALTLTHLSDRELVLGKLFGRLIHVGAIALSSLPILAFMHLWGNVDLSLIVYHEINTFLLLLSAGALCILVSTNSQSVFQAVSGSYSWLILVALIGILGAFMLPWIVGSFMWFFARTGGDPTPNYEWSLPPLVAVHLLFAWFLLSQAILQMERLRMEERRQPKKSTGAFTLTDTPVGPPPTTGKRGETRSRIHPWAWPVRGDAMWWKECIKDGTSYSLSLRWLLIGVAILAAIALPCGIIYRNATGMPREGVLAVISSFSFTFYFVAMAAYALVVLFQMTMTVAGEREHDTLMTLLMIPEDRSTVLFAKWVGPWWRNWPILAISLLGALFGWACGVYGILGLATLLLMPWAFLFMLGSLAILLSVLCRRVLFANIAVMAVLGLLILVHIVAGRQARMVLAFYVSSIGDTRIDELVKELTWGQASALALGEQAIFLLIGAVCIAAAFRVFTRRDYAGG